LMVRADTLRGQCYLLIFVIPVNEKWSIIVH
jgi:hypothetical protein